MIQTLVTVCFTQVTESNIKKVIKREDLLLILFHDDKQRPLAAQLKVSLVDLETLFGLAVVTVSDLKVAFDFGIGSLPAVVLFDRGKVGCEPFSPIWRL